MQVQGADYVDIREAMRMTGLKDQTIYRLARQGRVRKVKILGSRVRFSRADLAALVEEVPRREEA
jgi:excisionase family DNA binding protein